MRVADGSLRFASSGTLWRVEIGSETSPVVQATPVTRAPPNLLLATTAIYRSNGAVATSPDMAEWKKPTPMLPAGDDGREQAEVSLRGSFGDPDSLRPEPMAWNAIRLATGLVHDLRNASAVRAALASDGIPVLSLSAPDFVALEGDEWIRCLGWPVRDGRLRAPSGSIGLILDIVRLKRTEGPAWPCALGVAILPSSATCLATRILDWRTDEQVLEDVEDLAALVEKVQTRGRTEGLDALRSGLAKLSSSYAPSFREVFRLRRLLDVAEDRGNPLVPGFASVLPDIDRLRSLLDREIEERRRTMLGELAAEIEAERARRSSALDDLRNEVEDAKRSVAILRAREEAYRHAADELSVKMSDRVDRKIFELASAHESRSAAWLAEIETNRERLEALAARIGMIESDRRPHGHALDMVRKALEDEQIVSMLAGRIAEASPRGDAALQDAGVERSPEMLVSDPTAARASLRWHACENGVEEKSLHTGFSISAVGLLPIFVGAAAHEAAVALARAVGGEGFSTLHCDPTLIAASDLLDPKRARTDVLLAAIEAARRSPDRWHAVVLTFIDWAPCAYWLGALATIGREPDRIPRNLLIVGAAAADGPRTHVPLSALRSAVPIRAAGRLDRYDGDRPITDGWSTIIVATADADDDGQSDAHYRAEMIGLLGVDLSAASLRLIAGGARVGREVLRWTAEEASASLSFAAEWLAAARDGATLTPAARAAMETFASQDDT